MLTRDGTMYEQREIVLLPFPYSDLTGSKQRPALIISNKKLNNSEDRICCLITSKKPDEGILIKNCLESGNLAFESWIKPQRIFTINKKIIRKKLGSINKEFYEKIFNSINEYVKAE